jgi:hypothetical protein
MLRNIPNYVKYFHQQFFNFNQLKIFKKGLTVGKHVGPIPFRMEHVVMQERYEQPLIGLGLKDSGIVGCQMVCFQTKNPNLGTFW